MVSAEERMHSDQKGNAFVTLIYIYVCMHVYATVMNGQR